MFSNLKVGNKLALIMIGLSLLVIAIFFWQCDPALGALSYFSKYLIIDYCGKEVLRAFYLTNNR